MEFPLFCFGLAYCLTYYYIRFCHRNQLAFSYTNCNCSVKIYKQTPVNLSKLYKIFGNMEKNIYFIWRICYTKWYGSESVQNKKQQEMVVWSKE